MADAVTRKMLERAADQFAQGREGRIYFDELAPAVYRLEPDPAAMVACLRCEVVTVRPGAPRRSPVTIRCSSCATPIVCHPPREVVAYGAHGITIAAPVRGRPH